MNVIINGNSEWKTNSLNKKPSIRRDGSYRIYHITKRQKEDSEDDDIDDHLKNKIEQINETKMKPKKRSFKHFTRDGSEKSKRKSTKSKRLLFLHKTSCESISNELKTPTSSRLLTNDLSSSVISNDSTTNQSLKTNKQIHRVDSSESDVLGEDIDHTLNDLLARASQLETTVKKPEFNKIRPSVRISVQRRRKSFIIATSAFLIILILVVLIIIFAIIVIWRQKILANSLLKSSSIYDF